MSVRWRISLFVVLAVLLVLGVERLTANRTADHRQSQKVGVSITLPQPQRQKSSSQSKTYARLVPLYEAGDFHVDKPAKPRKKPTPSKKKPVQKKSPTLAKKNLLKEGVSKKPKSKNIIKSIIKPKAKMGTKKPVPGKMASKNLDGDRPVLEVDYEGIGFKRYLEIIERVGRLFVLISTEKGPRLGPEVSLKQGVVFTVRKEMSSLALKRPHLISDERIQLRLARIKIPEGALDDSVALIFSRPFDTLLWDIISETLRKHKLGLNQVSQIKGTYTEGAKGVFLRLKSVKVKATGKRVSLHRQIRVSL